MNKLFVFSGLMLLCGVSSAVGQLTVEQCYEKAKGNYPLIRRYDLIEKAREYNLSNAGKGYLPQIQFSAKASYQSEVTELPISMPGVKGLSKDQYSAVLDVSQVVWDGGLIGSKKAEVRTASEVESKSVDVDLYALRSRVNQLYFGILLFDAQLEQNRVYSDELGRNYDRVASCLRNGVANQADLDAVKVEQLKAVQNRSKLTHSRRAYVQMLSALIGENSETLSLVKPDAVYFSEVEIRRPELQLFAAQIKNLESKNRQLQSSIMPQISLFATGGYGRPGLNMLKSEFSPYYIAGARLSWNIGAFYTNRNSRRVIETNIQTIQTQQETFLFNTRQDIQGKQNDLIKCREQLTYDDEIIALRQSVKQSSEAKLQNGTISGIDLMRDVTAEELANQDKIYHEIELLMAVYNLKYLTNGQE